MNKSIIGIAILLFAILLQLSSASMEAVTLSLGLIGLITTIVLSIRYGSHHNEQEENKNV